MLMMLHFVVLGSVLLMTFYVITEFDKPYQRPKDVPITQVISSSALKELDSDLASSIREHGILNPIVVNDRYEIIDGNRRYAAAKAAGFDEVSVVVVIIRSF